jgi:Fe-S-cluster containining protein
MRRVLKGEQTADVPCGDCIGCCVSSYAIPLRPADTAALDAVPARYLRMSVEGGFARMDYRPDGSCPIPDGSCPMLGEGRCTIYADRPQTCRDYDCRLYAAIGLLPDGERPVIRERVREWQFEFTTTEEIAQRDAVLSAARFIREQAALFPPAARAHSAAAVAVLAVKTWPLFANKKGDRPEDLSPSEQAKRVLETARTFDVG